MLKVAPVEQDRLLRGAVAPVGGGVAERGGCGLGREAPGRGGGIGEEAAAVEEGVGGEEGAEAEERGGGRERGGEAGE